MTHGGCMVYLCAASASLSGHLSEEHFQQVIDSGKIVAMPGGWLECIGHMDCYNRQVWQMYGSS